MRCTFINRKLKMRNNLIYKFCTLLNLVDFNEHLIFFYLLKAFERENRGRLRENETKREREKKREKERERQRETERQRERERLNVIFIFLKVHLGDSNRQPQSSRENLE